LKTIKYCFVIDGLDEIKGDLSSLLSFIRKISKYPNIKVCISSRPWFIFGDEFSTKPNLMLQDLTEPDIKIYITSKFDSNVAFKELQIMDVKIAESLIEEIARKSSGVFLWVVLVLLSLEGLRDGDRLSDLQRKLDALPPELDNLFRQILHNFDPRYMKLACTLFRMVKSAPYPLSLLCLSLADEESTKLAVQAKAEPTLFFPRQRFYRALNMRRRLDSRCKGLLEAAPVWINEKHISSCDTLSANVLIVVEQQGDTPGVFVTIPPDDGKGRNAAILRDFSTLHPDRGDLLANADVEYLHRTVKDFLEQPDVWQQIVAATDANFQPHLALARSYVLQLKWVHFNTPAVVPKETWNAIFWVIEYCALAEASNVVDVELLGELGRRLRTWFRPPATSECPPSESSLKDFKRWPINPEQGPADFLHLAVQCGLRLYVEYKLGSIKPDDDYIESLLKTATSEYKVCYRRPKGPAFERDKPNLALIRMLLHHSNLSKKKKNLWIQEAETLLKDNSTSDENQVSYVTYDNEVVWLPPASPRPSTPDPRAPGPSVVDLSTEFSEPTRSLQEGFESIVEVEELASIPCGVDTNRFNQSNICSEERGSSGLDKQDQSTRKSHVAKIDVSNSAKRKKIASFRHPIHNRSFLSTELFSKYEHF